MSGSANGQRVYLGKEPRLDKPEARRARRRARGAVLGALALAALLVPLSTAHAGLLDRMKEIYQLPEQVESAQKQYEEAKRELADQAGRLEEQKDQLTETIRQSEETQRQLTTQNEQLREQNAALQERLLAMEQAEQERRANSRRLTMLGAAAAALVAGYFVLGRLIRVIVWKRTKATRP